MEERKRRIKNSRKIAEIRRNRNNLSPEGKTKGKKAIICQCSLFSPNSGILAVIERYFSGRVGKPLRFQSFFSAELLLNLFL